MGCAGSIEVLNPQITKITPLNTLSTHPLMTRLCLVANEQIHELNALYTEVQVGRQILFRITKVSLISKPTLLDAYMFWTQYVSMCNLGNSVDNNVLFSFKGEDFLYDIGVCGDLKLQWFGKVYQDYMNNVYTLKLRLPSILESLRSLQEMMLSQFKLDQQVLQNSQQIKQIIHIVKHLTEKLQDYSNEIDELIKKHTLIQEKADENGSKLYKRYGAKKLDQQIQRQSVMVKEKYIMKVKANLIITQCFAGKLRTEQEEQAQKDEKLQRAVMKSKKDYGDDVGIGRKKIPWRFRWTGCVPIDLSLSAISRYLEEHSHHLINIRRYAIFIKYITSTYQLADDNMTTAWKIFCHSLDSQQRLTLHSASSLSVGLELIKLKHPQADLCRKYFIKYLALFDSTRLQELKSMWMAYQQNQDRIINFWSDNAFLDMQEFREIPPQDRYYVLTSLAKNIYAFTTYQSQATSVYQSTYKKKVKQGLIFTQECQLIFQESQEVNKPFQEMYTHFQASDNALKVKKKLIKYKYTYEKFN